MALLLRDGDEPYWVTDEDLAATGVGDIVPDSEVAYLVRACTDDEQRAIRQPLVQMVFDRASHRKVERPLTPDEQSEVAQRVFEATVVDWRGIVGPGGAPLPCDSAGKRMLWRADKPRVLALFRVVNTMQSAADERKASSFRSTDGVGAVVG